MYGYLSQRYNKDILKIYIPMLLKMLSVKTIDWQYEKEWRLCSIPEDIENVDKASYISIKPYAIFVGARMPVDQRWNIYNIAKKKGIAVFEVWCNSRESKYKLNFCKLDGKELREESKKV